MLLLQAAQEAPDGAWGEKSKGHDALKHALAEVEAQSSALEAQSAAVDRLEADKKALQQHISSLQVRRSIPVFGLLSALANKMIPVGTPINTSLQSYCLCREI